MKYTREVLSEAAAHSTSIAGVLRHLGIKWSGGSHHHISRQLKRLGVDTSHFTGRVHNRGATSPTRRRPDEIFVVLPDGSRRAKRSMVYRAMLEVGVPEHCAGCGIGTSWQGRPLVLHIDHINGDPMDNRAENLRFLCPNCHSQTATYAGRRRVAVVDAVECFGRAATSPTRVPRSRSPQWHPGPWTQTELEF